MVSINDLLESYLVADIDLERMLRRDVLDASPDLSGRAVGVRVTDGVATLTGRIAEIRHLRALVNAVATFEGVVGVVNRLSTGPARRTDSAQAVFQRAD
jgi:osmotically-inducible protein OsmY